MTTWYHWVWSTNFLIDDRGLTDRMREGQKALFSEDIEIVDSRQRNIRQRKDHKLVNLKIDAGGVPARSL